MYNTVIDGHDEEPAGDDGEGILEGAQSSSSKVPEMTPEEVIACEKCVVFTDIIMSLLNSVHGNICKRKDCGRLLEYRKMYAGTCLVVSWRCSAGHFGGRWAANQHASKSGQETSPWLLLCCFLEIHSEKWGLCSNSATYCTAFFTNTVLSLPEFVHRPCCE